MRLLLGAVGGFFIGFAVADKLIHASWHPAIVLAGLLGIGLIVAAGSHAS